MRKEKYIFKFNKKKRWNRSRRGIYKYLSSLTFAFATLAFARPAPGRLGQGPRRRLTWIVSISNLVEKILEKNSNNVNSNSLEVYTSPIYQIYIHIYFVIIIYHKFLIFLIYKFPHGFTFIYCVSWHNDIDCDLTRNIVIQYRIITVADNRSHMMVIRIHPEDIVTCR